jgi:hypothetical protein
MRRLLILMASLALAAPSQAAPKPTWKTFADCAAAYEANAAIKDPERSAQMSASIQDVAQDYLGAALGLRKPKNDAAVRAYVAEKRKAFAAKPRRTVEKFIEACPPTDA